MDYKDVKECGLITQRNITELIATPFVFSGLQFGYDQFLSGLSDEQRMTDFYISFTSSILSKLMNYGIVDTTIDYYKNKTENTLVSYISTPVFNTLAYSILYYYYYFFSKNAKYKGQDAGRSLTEVALLGFISGFAQQLSNKAIISWISGMNYLY